jgi:hypothetical protein
MGRSTPADTVDHRVPHRGDLNLFVTGELASLCRSCHSSIKQQQEIHGFSRQIGPDGWPTDANHPVYRGK